MKNTFKIKKISFLCLILLSFACQKDDDPIVSQADDTITKADDRSGIACRTKMPHANSTKGVQLDDTLLWDVGQTITVSFLDTPSDLLRSNVETFAPLWENHANIQFVFLPDGRRNADITIGILAGQDTGGHVNGLGRQIVDSKDSNDLNMFLGRFSWRRTILHEFGHALGLTHEQLSPEFNLCVITDEVYAYYEGINVDTETIDSQILDIISYDYLTNSSDYDVNSIMHYYFPPASMCDGISRGGRSTISTIDAEFISALYPFSWTFNTPIVASSTFGITDNWGNNTHKTVADVNGDGRGDIVAFGINDTFVALGRTNGTFQTPIRASSTFATNDGWGNLNRKLADVNGDGRADIIGFGLNDTFVALGKNNGTFGAPFKASSTFGTNDGWGNLPRKVADVNGDGRGDIVAFGVNDTFVALGNVNGTFGNPFVGSTTYGNTDGWANRVREVSDVNNDGRADIIGFGSDDVVVSLANTNGTFGTAFISVKRYFTDWNNTTNLLRIADINGDNLKDIVGFGDEFIWVSYGEGNGNFQQSHTRVFNKFTTFNGWNSSHTRKMHDINGDGRADIIGFGQSDTYVSISNE